MPDPAIQTFFEERKAAWLKKSSRPSMSEAEIENLQTECDVRFSLEKWIPDAAARAGQIDIATHPCTFSHPSSRKNKNGYTTSIIADAKYKVDGFLRTGNIEVKADALGNAAALDVHKFLSLEMSDGDSLLDHLRQKSQLSKDLLKNSGDYEELRKGFMAMTSSGDESISSSKLKQVFFPVESDYHLLSVLTNSGILYELRKRLDGIRFSEKAKALRLKRRANEFSEEVFVEIFDLTTVSFGGTKPQNVSVLNTQNAGKAHLLPSLPPKLQEFNFKFPKTNFFRESVRYWDGKEAFERLHRIFSSGTDEKIPQRHLKSGRDKRIEQLLDIVVVAMYSARASSKDQYRNETSRLSDAQQVWLVDNEEMRQRRSIEDAWLDQVVAQITDWILAGYRWALKKPIQLDTAEKGFIRQLVEQDKEILR